MNYKAILTISGIMTLISVLLSVHLIMKHKKNWTRPVQQKNIVIIILMAPIFAIDAFVGILELEKGEVIAHMIDMVKECYEAVVINSFLLFMYDQCGLPMSSDKNVLPDGIKGRELHVPFPLGMIYGHPHFDMVWFKRLKSWTIQFIICRPVLSILDLVLVDLFPNAFSKITSIVIAILLNVSVTTAIFSLLTFYHAFEKELASARALAKFLCIKGVVFFATWQGVVLKLMAYFGILHEGYRFSVDEIALAWQDLLICIEMGLIFSPLHFYAFPPDAYKEMDKAKKTN